MDSPSISDLIIRTVIRIADDFLIFLPRIQKVYPIIGNKSANLTEMDVQRVSFLIHGRWGKIFRKLKGLLEFDVGSSLIANNNISKRYFIIRSIGRGRNYFYPITARG